MVSEVSVCGLLAPLLEAEVEVKYTGGSGQQKKAACLMVARKQSKPAESFL